MAEIVVGRPLRGVPSVGMRTVRLSSDDRGVGACGPPRLCFAVLVAAAVAALAIVGHCVPAPAAASAFSPQQQPSIASLPVAVHASADQPQLAQERANCKASKVFAIDAIPKVAVPALVLLGVALAALAARGWLTQLVAPAGRSPPHARVAILSGQDLLTRICLARR